MLSSMHLGADGSMVKRHVGGSKQLVPCPPMIPFYNKYMGGVDQLDHMCKVYGVFRKCYRWTNVFLYGFLDSSVVNSFVLYKKLNPEVSTVCSMSLCCSSDV
jgi:hypothetical protein